MDIGVEGALWHLGEVIVEANEDPIKDGLVGGTEGDVGEPGDFVCSATWAAHCWIQFGLERLKLDGFWNIILVRTEWLWIKTT